MNDITTVLGGMEFPVKKRDGTEEIVKIAQLPIRKLQHYMLVIDDEAAQVELFCGQEKGWAETLTLESFDQIMVEGEKLNLDFMTRSAARANARREKIMPGAQDKIEKLLSEKLETLLPTLLQGAASLSSNSPTARSPKSS